MQSKRIIACQACHKRKVRCSGGGPPCTTCRESSLECVYPVKDRKTKVGQRYLEKLVEENKRLQALVSTIHSPESSPPAASAATEALPRADNADLNPIMERPWFMAHNASDLPIHIGEAADAAFATRLRQAASSKPVSHLPRIHYMSDDMLRSLTDTNLEWPSPARLRYLVNVALSTVCKVWHIVRKSVVLACVNAVIHDPSSIDWLSACRLWTLLALGEAYSSRCTLPDSAFPGAKYFARAMAMVHIPSERPRLALVEIYLLLSIFASNLNRRHTATFMASYALRVSIILGLHIEISETQLQDRQVREHRCRLWWTVYCFDRMWASKIGWPPSIQDSSIEIGLPSDNGLPVGAEADLHDAEHITFVVRLTQLTNNAVGSLYVRKRQPTSFSERVQTAVKAVSDWANDLPPRLQLRPEDSGVPNERHVLYMHLSFNQSVIVTTRPILLHLLKQRRADSETNKTLAPLSDSALSLTTACIRCARNSLSLLKRAWTDGTIAAFDYFSTQYIFASATILALSCLLQSSGWKNDSEEFLLAVQFLQELDRNGNYAAKEYYTHIEALKVVVTDAVSERAQVGASIDGTPSSTTFGDPLGSQVVAMPDYVTPSASDGSLQYPQLQDFLNQPTIDLDFMETGGSWLDWNEIAWPESAPLNGTL